MRRRSIGLITACAVLALVAPASAAQLQTWTTTSRFVDPTKVKMNSPPPGAPARENALRVNVYLPDGYDGKTRFPVLYLLHGHGDAYDYWANQQRGDLLDIAKGFPAIVVMPEGATGWYTNWWNGGARSNPAWERYHLDELIPLVEKRLKIRRGRQWHAIAGLSMGGEGALFYASQRPGYFGSAASFSGVISIQRPEWPAGFDTQGEDHNLVFGDPDKQSFYWEGHNPTALVENLRYTRVYVSVGDGTPGPDPGEIRNTFGQIAERELHMQADDFVAAAQTEKVDVHYRQHQGIHDWPYWRADLADAIANWGFFNPVPEQPSSWTFETVAQSSNAYGIRFTFTKPPEVLETFKFKNGHVAGNGAGTVTVRTPGRFSFRATLPFDRKLPKNVRRCLRPHKRSTLRCR